MKPAIERATMYNRCTTNDRIGHSGCLAPIVLTFSPFFSSPYNDTSGSQHKACATYEDMMNARRLWEGLESSDGRVRFRTPVQT